MPSREALKEIVRSALREAIDETADRTGLRPGLTVDALLDACLRRLDDDRVAWALQELTEVKHRPMAPVTERRHDDARD